MNYEQHTQAVTARLVDMITNNETGEWVMPWHTRGIADQLRARNATTGAAYTGANVITLAIEGIDHGYPTGAWATYRQWQNAGAQVLKGERSTRIIKWIPKRTSDEDTESETQLIPRTYAVFNAHQIDANLAVGASCFAMSHGARATANPAPVDEWLAAIGAEVIYGGDRAYYSPTADRIYSPAIDQFDDPAAFYGTIIHEHIHWTGHRDRLGRDINHPFASTEYATEELVAELGSAIACAFLGVEPEPRPDHAAYIEHWIGILGEDPKTLFRSAAAAQRAVDYLNTHTGCRAQNDQ